MKKTTAKEAATKKSKKYLLQLTGKGFILGLCLLFLISGWMFVLGVLVGRGTAPINFDIQALQKELLELKESMVKQEKRAMEADVAKTGDKPSLDFHEALKKKEKDEKIQAVEKKIPPKSPSKAPLISQKRISKTKETQTEERLLPSVEPDPTGSLAVQVASTKDADSADALVEKLKQLGYAAFSIKAEIPNKGTWYRVRVGPYETRSDADQVHQGLTRDKFEGIIVKN